MSTAQLEEELDVAEIGGAGSDSSKSMSNGARVASAVRSRSGMIIVFLVALLWTIPTFGVGVSSIRPENDVKTTGWWEIFSTRRFTLENYSAVLSSGTGGDALVNNLWNSLMISIPSVILSVGLALFAAYAFSWMRFPGRDWMFVGMVGLLMVPLQMALIPLLQLFTGGAHLTLPGLGTITLFPDLDLNGTFLSVWIAHTMFGMPFCVFILRNFVSAIPVDIIEAAKIDGAGHGATFFKLIVPLSVPALASLTIFQFMWIWNDYLIGLIYAGRENAPVTAALATLTGTRGQSWHLLTAGGMVAMILPIIVFLALQRYFVRGLLAGAVKG